MRVCACVRLRAGHVLGCLLGGAIVKLIDRETDEIDGAISSEIDSEIAYDIDIEIDTGIDGGIDSEGPPCACNAYCAYGRECCIKASPFAILQCCLLQDM